MRETGFTRREAVAGSALLLAAPMLGASAEPDRVPADPAIWRFLVIGDWGRDGQQGQQKTADAMAVVWDNYGPEFVISTGDNFYNWGVRSATDYRWKSCFENVYTPRIKPWYSVLGNHDYGGSVEAQIARGAMGGRWNMDNRWWHRPLAPVGRPSLDMFFFDTVAWHGKEKLPHSISGATVSPADHELQKNAMGGLVGGSKADIKIAFGHHGVWSIGPHGGKRDLVDLDKLLRDNGVRAWVHGHDHCLFHVQQGAMHYICSGAGSKMLAKQTQPGACPVGGCADLGPVEKKSHFGKDEIAGGFALFELSRDTGSFTFFDSDAKPLSKSPVRIY